MICGVASGCSVSIASWGLLAALCYVLGISLPDEPEALKLRRIEAELLHRPANLQGLRVWQPKEEKWIPTVPPETPLLIVHIWAVECRPCLTELPIILRMAQTFGRSSKVRSAPFLFITESDDGPLRSYLREHDAEFGPTAVYRADERLRQGLETMQQPLTLLVDRRGVIRQAFVGSLLGRRSEFVLAVERLLDWL